MKMLCMTFRNLLCFSCTRGLTRHSTDSDWFYAILRHNTPSLIKVLHHKYWGCDHLLFGVFFTTSTMSMIAMSTTRTIMHLIGSAFFWWSSAFLSCTIPSDAFPTALSILKSIRSRIVPWSMTSTASSLKMPASSSIDCAIFLISTPRSFTSYNSKKYRVNFVFIIHNWERGDMNMDGTHRIGSLYGKHMLFLQSLIFEKIRIFFLNTASLPLQSTQIFLHKSQNRIL